MAGDSSSHEEILQKLIENVEKPIAIIVEREDQCEWTKDLSHLPLFTIKEIENHRKKSGKNEKSIIKTRDRGLKFKEEGYVSKDSIFTKRKESTFMVKGDCSASMKPEMRQVKVTLNQDTGEVIHAVCSCPAGKSSYCNHVMALLFELADFSLHGYKEVPEDIACTSGSRRWGIPSDSNKYPEPVMNVAVQKRGKSKGINCTLYNPRINSKNDNLVYRAAKTNLSLVEQDKRIGYAHIMNFSLPMVATRNGDFFTGSPLSYQLSVFEDNFKVITNIETVEERFIENFEKHIPLPYQQIDTDTPYFPTNWGILNYSELLTLSKIFPESIEKCQDLETNTVGQSSNKAW